MSSSVFEGMLDQPTGQRSTKHADYTHKQGAGSGSGSAGGASGAGGDTRYGKPSGGYANDKDRLSSSVFEGMLDQPTATTSTSKSAYVVYKIVRVLHTHARSLALHACCVRQRRAEGAVPIYGSIALKVNTPFI